MPRLWSKGNDFCWLLILAIAAAEDGMQDDASQKSLSDRVFSEELPPPNVDSFATEYEEASESGQDCPEAFSLANASTAAL